MDWSRCAVDRNPGKLGGVWCFRGTRLPVATLFEYIDRGSTVDEFLEAFPSVTREHVHVVLAFAKGSLECQRPSREGPFDANTPALGLPRLIMTPNMLPVVSWSWKQPKISR